MTPHPNFNGEFANPPSGECSHVVYPPQILWRSLVHLWWVAQFLVARSTESEKCCHRGLFLVMEIWEKAYQQTILHKHIESHFLILPSLFWKATKTSFSPVWYCRQIIFLPDHVFSVHTNFVLNIDFTSGQCYKTSLGHNLLMFLMRWVFVLSRLF
jgi:hypothetical protein